MTAYGSSIIYLTNPDGELRKAELTYRSQYEDANGKVHQMGEPLMNERGITSVIGQMQSLVNQVTIMSNLEEKEIQSLIMMFANTIIKDLMINRTRYDIKRMTDRNKIFSTAISTCYICMKRAYKEGDKRFWKGSVQELKTTVESSGKKGGILSSFNPWAK